MILAVKTVKSIWNVNEIMPRNGHKLTKSKKEKS